MSIFWRAFVAFMLAMALAVTGFMVVPILLNTDPSTTELQRMEDVLRVAAPEACRYSDEELQPYLSQLEEIVGGSIRRVAADTAATRDPDMNALVTEALRAGDGNIVRDPLHLRLALAAHGPQNKRFVLVGEGVGGVVADLVVPITRILITVLAAALVCYGLALWFATPIQTLQEATRRLAEGDFAVRVGNDPALRQHRDELAALAQDFDALAARLEAGRDSQRQLIADISHELRSPLHRLGMALELARMKAGPDASQAMARMERESERMNELIGELLTLTRLEHELEQRQPEWLDLKALVEAITADAAFEAAARDCRVVSLLPQGEVALIGSRELLHRAIENVLRNALRYTEEKSQVEVHLRVWPEETELVVRDFGPGVPADALPSLFRPFWRVGTDRDRTTGGYGLGLAIADRAIRLHGGTITAENAPGGGLRITFRLPRPA